MMQEVTTEGWRPTVEDAMSSSSEESRSEMTMLRLPGVHVRRMSAMTPLKRKAVITSGVCVVLLIAGVTIGTVYSGSEDGGSSEHHSVARNTVYLKDFARPSKEHFGAQTSSEGGNDNYNFDELPQNDHARPISGEHHQPGPNLSNLKKHVLHANTGTSQGHTSTKHRRRSRGPMHLPANAHNKSPISLLLQMKLVHPPTDSYVKYTQCIDEVYGKKLFMGWQANLSVNTTLANISESRNPFIGYGKDKKLARRQAGAHALMAIYPGQLIYTEEDVSSIKEFCDDDVPQEHANTEEQSSPAPVQGAKIASDQNQARASDSQPGQDFSLDTEKAKKNSGKARDPMRIIEESLAQETPKPPRSLLLEIGLVKPPTMSYLNHTECIDETSGKISKKGWKANLFVNTTMANITESHNPFIGYGANKDSATRHASEAALMAIYPGKLIYPKEDVTAIKIFCGD